jgi:hypothetical protein
MQKKNIKENRKGKHKTGYSKEAHKKSFTYKAGVSTFQHKKATEHRMGHHHKHFVLLSTVPSTPKLADSPVLPSGFL